MFAIVKSEEEFKKFVMEEKDKLSLAYFFATWCGPCKTFAPVYEKFSSEFSDVNFLKIDIDILSEVSASYGILSIPTIVAFKNGVEVGREIGVPTDFVAFIKDYI